MFINFYGEVIARQ